MRDPTFLSEQQGTLACSPQAPPSVASGICSSVFHNNLISFGGCCSLASGTLEMGPSFWHMKVGWNWKMGTVRLKTLHDLSLPAQAEQLFGQELPCLLN